MDFWQKIEQLQFRRRLAQTDIAHILGLHPSSLSLMKKEKRFPDFGAMIHLQKTLSISLDSLASETDDYDVAPLRPLVDRLSKIDPKTLPSVTKAIEAVLDIAENYGTSESE